MSKVIMIGCDLHQRSMLLRYCVDNGQSQKVLFENTQVGRAVLVDWLVKLADKEGAERTVFVYEASGLGYGLCDQLHEAGIECHVLSPTHLPKSAKQAKQKTDDKDAQALLEVVRGHVLAGNSLPAVWTPPQRLRDDRELVRARIDAADETTRIKLQTLSLLKRRNLVVPGGGHHWSKRFRGELAALAERLDECVAPVLKQLLERYELCVRHQAHLDKALHRLAATERYRVAVTALRALPGVGLLTALTFVTEMGDLTRFHNRREVAAYLGLCPSSFESGDNQDRKGHITRQGPARVRKLLCQATWVSLQHCAATAQAYGRIRGAKPNRGKKALVAMMRRLAIRMWHLALGAGVSVELEGRGGPHKLPGGRPVA